MNNKIFSVCDLCDSHDYSVLVRLETNNAMMSDRRIVSQNLLKVECLRCGLVRNLELFTDKQETNSYYEQDYSVSSDPEHFFYTNNKAIGRSDVIANWITESMGLWRWNNAKYILEIGAGSGLLLEKFAEIFPSKLFMGIEPSKKAVEIGIEKSLNIKQGLLEDVINDVNQQFDIVYSIATIEHTISPKLFLLNIHKLLKKDGYLFLVQPIQDIISYDIFFIDHLYHFSTAHLRQYALACGFKEIGYVIGHELMPNFSLHLWQATDLPNSEFNFFYENTACKIVVDNVLKDIQQLDNLLLKLQQKKSKVAVFGLSEVYWLVNAYSNLKNFPIAFGLDDNPHKKEYSSLCFSVVTPEQSLLLGVTDIILTMNKHYYPIAYNRF